MKIEKEYLEELQELQEEIEEEGELEKRFQMAELLGDAQDLYNKNIDVVWFECGNCGGTGKHKMYEDEWECRSCLGQGGKFIKK